MDANQLEPSRWHLYVRNLASGLFGPAAGFLRLDLVWIIKFPFRDSADLPGTACCARRFTVAGVASGGGRSAAWLQLPPFTPTPTHGQLSGGQAFQV